VEGLIYLVAGLIAGWQFSYLFWVKKIRADESARVMTRVLSLESALRWEKARGDAFLEDIKRRYEARG
jgi:hypothetical protein